MAIINSLVASRSRARSRAISKISNNVQIKFLATALLLLSIFNTSSLMAQEQLQIFQNNQDISKYSAYQYQPDHISVVWDGSGEFRDADNNIFTVPKWYARQLPKEPLTGLIAVEYSEKSAILRILRQKNAERAWQKIKFIAIDFVKSKDIFKIRQLKLQKLQPKTQYWQLQSWRQLQTAKQFDDLLEKHYKAGDHGFILYDTQATINAKQAKFWAPPYSISTAQVAAINPGRGSFLGLMGSIEVIDNVGNQFSIGTGFNRLQRKNPPPIGSNIKYRYKGYTATGKPKTPIFIEIVRASKTESLHFANILTIIFSLIIVALVLIDGYSYFGNGRHLDFKATAVSFGLLGTFVGIWWGLYQFDANDVIAGVPQLIAGLKFSFITSIEAIALTTLLSIVQKLRPNEH